MKKISIVLAAVLLISGTVFANGGKEAAGNQDTRPTIRLITDATGIDDKSFNAAAWRGILEFYGDTWDNQSQRGDLYDVITCATQDLYIPTLKLAADEGYDLIVTTGFTFADATAEVAELYPDQKFMIVDVDWLSNPNVQQFIFAEEEGSFLVGAASALQAKEDGIKDPKFGFIGGVPGSVITRFELGFYQGVKTVLPEAKISDYYANSWGAPELGKAQAKNWFDAGVYAIFSAAGATGNGAIAQAKEYRIQGQNVWAIGVDSDQYQDGIYEGTKSSVLTSMVKKVETATLTSLNEVANGSWAAGARKLGLVEDGVDYAKTNPELSPDVMKKLETYRKDILDGKIKLYNTYASAMEAGVVPAGLGAKD